MVHPFSCSLLDAGLRALFFSASGDQCQQQKLLQRRRAVKQQLLTAQPTLNSIWGNSSDSHFTKRVSQVQLQQCEGLAIAASGAVGLGETRT